MIYDIRLNIHYTYTTPAAGGRQLLRITPLEEAGRQTVLSASVDIAPDPVERRAWTDFFGNQTVEFALRGAHDHVDLTLTARVERADTIPDADASVPLSGLPAVLAACRDLGPASPLHCASASKRIPDLPQIASYAQDVLATLPPDATVAQAVMTLGAALHRDIRFDARATTVDTPLAEAFANRRGVCQDMSHIMIGALRSLGIPAGYVSGFLRTSPPPGRPRLEGADAMHAWVRAWCGPQTGWLEYDPTNDCVAGSNHIEVARGRDYADVAPVKGMLRVAGGQTSRQAVDVIPLQP
ncbi:MAG: transglutaminase family protein [Rhodobacterales bacterium]|nr:transglutaminase family protein [Rhodobacterales bacterium]MDX5412565.1 transglutaminase family protein [Rhodobacterales bacterium]